MIGINSDFLYPYIINSDGNVVTKDLIDYLTIIDNKNLNVLHMNIRSYNRNINEFWCMINDPIKCLDIIISIETWNITMFIPHMINGFSN